MIQITQQLQVESRSTTELLHVLDEHCKYSRLIMLCIFVFRDVSVNCWCLLVKTIHSYFSFPFSELFSVVLVNSRHGRLVAVRFRGHGRDADMRRDGSDTVIERSKQGVIVLANMKSVNGDKRSSVLHDECKL